MKTIFTFVLFIFTFSALAQERVEVAGKINPPVGEDPQGISIINRTAKSATISNVTGNFKIKVAAGDTLHFSSLQFRDFSVAIDKGVVDSRKLNVFLTEAVTELPEVVVSPYDLTGNVRVDVTRIPSSELDLPVKSAAQINPYEHTFRLDEKTSPANAAMRDAMINNGANFANIFRSIYTNRDKSAKSVTKNDLDTAIINLYEDDFFHEYLQLEKENIREFIYFAEDNGLKKSMLEPSNQMDLIEFLIAQSELYKQRLQQD